MGVENFGKVTEAGQRTAKRSRVLLNARLETPFGSVDARLRDLSRKGALIECAEPLAVGTSIVFTRGQTIVEARVAWTSGRRVGIEFQRMIDEGEVLVQLGRAPRPTVQPRYRRPGLFENMSEHDRLRVRQWGRAMGLFIPD